MDTEGGCEYILALPLKIVHSQNEPRCMAAAVLVLLSAVIRSSSVAHTRNPEIRSVLSSYKQMRS